MKSYDLTSHQKLTPLYTTVLFSSLSLSWRACIGRLSCAQVAHLNGQIAEQSAKHLDQLVGSNHANGRGEEGQHRGSCAFNLTLINAMDPASERPDLKSEPTFEAQAFTPCSVSWHADSTLEPFSTIAVYHTTDAEKRQLESPDWKLALRVCPVSCCLQTLSISTL